MKKVQNNADNTKAQDTATITHLAEIHNQRWIETPKQKRKRNIFQEENARQRNLLSFSISCTDRNNSNLRTALCDNENETNINKVLGSTTADVDNNIELNSIRINDNSTVNEHANSVHSIEVKTKCNKQILLHFP